MLDGLPGLCGGLQGGPIGRRRILQAFPFGMSDTTTSKLYTTLMSVNLEAGSAVAYYLRMATRYPGRLVAIAAETQTGTPGVTEAGLYIGAGGGPLSAFATGTTHTADLAAINTTVFWDFDEADQVFEAGDTIGVAFEPTSNWGNTEGTIWFEFWPNGD